MKKIPSILFFLFFQISLFSQTEYRKKSTKPDANYFEIVKNTRTYFNNFKKGKTKISIKVEKQEKQFERWAYLWKDRIDKEGKFPNENTGYYNEGILDAAGRIVTKTKNTNSKKTSAENWINIGPQENPVPNGYPNFPQLGRLNTFLRIKHSSDRAQDVLFVGAPAGGLWKSTDNGATWSAKLDNVAGIGVTDIKTASTTTFSNYTTKPIYVSTGDYDGGNVKSIGVLKSMDGGNTFTSTGLSHTISEDKKLGQLVVLDDNTVLVGENQFIKKTFDGGVNWTNVYDAGYNQANFGRVATSGTNIMYAGGYEIYFSSDSGANWTNVFTLDDDAEETDKHAVTVGSDGAFYAQAQNGQVKKYDMGAGTFSNLGTIGAGYEAQGGYNQTLIFKDGLFVSGEFNGQTSTDNGATWHRSLNGYYNPNGTGVVLDGTYVHSDHHAMGLLDGQYEFWSVNDGGLNFITYSSVNDVKPTTTYKSNGVINSQLYDVAITPNAGTGNYMMALQDNDGFSKEMHNGSMQWIAASAGDGVCAVINYNDIGIRYLGSQNGGLSKTGTGFSGKYNGESYGSITGAGFVWPLEIHTTDPTILYAGGDDLYKITDPNAGADLATSIAAATNLNSGAGLIGKIATHGTGVAVVGENSSKISVNSGISWATIPNPTGLTINSVDFDQSIMSIVYCTVSGYTDGSKVFKSTDSGVNWTNISNGLPNLVMKEVVLKQNEGSEVLFVGTELGVYFKSGTQNWAKLGQSLPNVIVNDIDINYTEERLVAGTYGRGLWHIDIADITLGNESSMIAENSFKVYPNPVEDGNLNFHLDKKYTNFKYKIYNILGGVVLEGNHNSNNNTINVSKLEKGIYMFKAYKEGVNFPTIKFMVTNK
jgi:xyloglucan-specific exo-beta-1,4-glucanase